MKRRSLVLFIFLLTFVVSGCGLFGSDQEPIPVRGRVTIDGAAPGETKVTVSAKGTSSSTTADAQGNFSLELLPGTYTLRAESDGLIAASTPINVKKGSQGIVDVALNVLSALRYDFSTMQDGAVPAGFEVFEGEWKIENGQLIGTAASFAGGQIVFGDPEWTDFEYEATITYVAFNDATRWAAMMYRGQPKGGHPYQLFTVRQGAAAANGAELAHRTPNDAWNVIIRTPLASHMELGKAYRFKVVVQGAGAKYYIDDKLVIESESDVTETKGTLGFMVDGGTIAVDDILVRLLN